MSNGLPTEMHFIIPTIMFVFFSIITGSPILGFVLTLLILWLA